MNALNGSVRILEEILRASTIVVARIFLIKVHRGRAAFVQIIVPADIGDLILCIRMDQDELWASLFCIGENEFTIALCCTLIVSQFIVMPDLVRISVGLEIIWRNRVRSTILKINPSPISIIPFPQIGSVIGIHLLNLLPIVQPGLFWIVRVT